MWHIILKWYFIIVTITVFSLHVHYTHHLPYGNLAICYWKWPIEIVVSHCFTYEWLWFSMANCNRLPEGVWSKNKYNSIRIHIYISLSLSPPTPADARGSASRIGGFRLCNNKNNNNSSSSSNNSSSVRRGRCFCHLLGTKLRGGLLFRSVTKAYRQPVLWGWLAGWLAARLQEGASSWKKWKKIV